MTDATIRINVDASRARDGARVIKRDLNEIDKSADRARGGVDQLRAAFAALGGVLALRELSQLADQFTEVQNLARIAAGDIGNVNSTLDELFRIAQRTRQPIAQVTELFQRGSIAAKELGASQEELFQFTELVGQGLAAQGGSASAAAGALTQLSQALGSGTIRAEEFNSILEGAFPIAQAAARGLDAAGGSVARLRQMVIDGEVSSEQFFRALLSQSDELAETFESTTATVGQGFTQLRNGLVAFIGLSDQAIGASSGFARFLGDLGTVLTSAAFDAGESAKELGTANDAVVDWSDTFLRVLGFTVDGARSAFATMGAILSGGGLTIAAAFGQAVALIQGDIGRAREIGNLWLKDIGALADELASFDADKFRDAVAGVIGPQDEAAESARRLQSEAANAAEAISKAGGSGADTATDRLDALSQALADVRRETMTASEALQADFTDSISTLQAALDEGLINEQEFRRLAERVKTNFWDQFVSDGEAAVEETRTVIDEVRRQFEGRFGEGLTDGLLDSLQAIEEVRLAFEDFDGPFNQSIDRMLEGLQTFNVAAEKGGEQAFQLYTQGTAQMLGGVQNLASEGTRAYEQLGAAITVLQGITAIQAILNQGAAGDPFTAFARMAAMAGAVASMGVAVSGSFGGGGDASRNTTTGTGTVFGDSDAMSESIANSVEITAEATESLVGINTRMLRALEGLQRGIAGFSNLLTRIPVESPSVDASVSSIRDQLSGELGGSFASMQTLGGSQIAGLSEEAFGALGIGFAEDVAGALGNAINEVLGSVGDFLFGADLRVYDEGIRILGGNVADLIDGAVVQAFIEGEKERRFGSDTQIFETGAVSDQVSQQINLLLGQVVNSAVAAASAVGIDQSSIDRILSQADIENIRISTQGDADQVAENINAAFSNLFDQVAIELVPFIDELARAGEGYAETLTRVANNVQVAAAGLDRVGGEIDALAAGGFGSRLRDRTQNIAELSTALIDAAGGFSEFGQLTKSFVDDFRSESEQLDIATREVSSALDQLGIQMPETREGFADLIDGFRITDEATARTYAELLRLAPALDEVFSASEEIREEQLELQIRLLRAQGRETAALNLERERELENVSDSNRALLRQVQAAEAAAEAQRELARQQQRLADAARSVSQSLAREIASLRGQSVAAVQIGNVLDAVGGASSPLELVEAAGSIQAALAQQLREQLEAIDQQSAAIDARNQAEIDAINEQIAAVNEQISAAERLRDVARGIRDYVAGLDQTDLGGGTPLQQLEAAQARFGTLTAAARAGDVDSARALQGQADAVLNLARDIFASGDRFQAIREQITGSLSETAGRVDVTAPELQALNNQLAILERQQDTLAQIRDNQPIQVGDINAAADEHTERLRRETADQLEDVQSLLGLIEDVTLLSKAEQVDALRILQTALGAIIRGGDLDTVAGLDDVRDAIDQANAGIVSGDQAIAQILDGGFDTLAGAFRDAIVGLGADVSGLSEALTRAALANADEVADAIDQANASALAQAEWQASAIISPIRALGFETAGMRAQLVDQFREQILEQQLTNELSRVLGAETRGVQSLVDAAASIISGNVNASGRDVVRELFGLQNLENITRNDIVSWLASVRGEQSDASNTLLGLLGVGRGTEQNTGENVNATSAVQSALLGMQALTFSGNLVRNQHLGAVRSALNAQNSAEGLPTYAMGGIANRPSIFGEAGPEAAVPLPDGRTIPVTLSGGGNDDVVRELRQLRQRVERQEAHLEALVRVEQAGWKRNAEQTDRVARNTGESARAARLETAS